MGPQRRRHRGLGSIGNHLDGVHELFAARRELLELLVGRQLVQGDVRGRILASLFDLVQFTL